MPIEARTIATHLASCATPLTADAKGKAYEDLAAYLFSEIPGCLVERDIISPLRTEQVDVAVGNPQGAIPLLPEVFLVECKDWEKPVDSSTLGYFINTCAGRSVPLGVLIAAQGVTGN